MRGDSMDYVQAAKSVCKSATEIEGYGPYRLFGDHVSEVWFLCKEDKEYEICFILERKGLSKVVRGVAEFVRWVGETYQSSSAAQNEIPLTANLLAIGVLLLVGTIAVGGHWLELGSLVQGAAAIVLVVFGAGVALRFFGYHVKIKDIDLAKFVGFGGT